MYIAVPSKAPPRSMLSIFLEAPKSHNFKCPLPMINTFSGFKSEYTYPLWCIHCNPANISNVKNPTMCDDRRLVLYNTCECKSPPCANSKAKCTLERLANNGAINCINPGCCCTRAVVWSLRWSHKSNMTRSSRSTNDRCT